MPEMNDVLEACSELDERLAAGNQSSQEAITKHLQHIERKLKVPVPEFKTGLEWLNVSSPLTLSKSLKGKIVVLDFFTYCCINCMHVLPDLEALGDTYSVEDGVAIVGVHSAKFANEKVSANILSAVLRYDIRHPVVNDSDASLWTALMIACWPTFVIVGPDGQFLYVLVGEGHRDRLLDFVSVALTFYKDLGQIDSHSLPIELARNCLPASPLKFPGKIDVSEEGKTLTVADTGHHRVLVLDKNGLVKHVIGGQERGYSDGTFSEAKFSSPQGVTMLGKTVFIADTDNHVIRKADLHTGQVTTLVGTGKQGKDTEGGNSGTDQEISSPWDVTVGGSPDCSDNKVLYIAMAGTHQIWVYFLEDTVWYKNREFKAGVCVRFAGSGIEENRNNSYPEKAGFAQPSGLALSSRAGANCLYVADSESSSVRQIQLSDMAVKGLAGGDIDPRNLFAYGDEDGVWTKAKLQHPLGVSLVTDEEGPLLVADSYNHKIKTVDIKSKECCTLVGSGHAGSAKGDNLLASELNEPGGLCVDQKNRLVYIADTNNHDIKVLELETSRLYSLPVIFPDLEHELLREPEQVQSQSVNVQPGSEGSVDIYIVKECAAGVHLNEEAPNSWELYSEDDYGQTFLPMKKTGTLSPSAGSERLLSVPVAPPSDAKQTTLCLKCQLFVCEDAGLCRMETVVLKETMDLSQRLQHIGVTFKLKVT